MSKLDDLRNAAKAAVKEKETPAVEKDAAQFAVETGSEFYRAFAAAPTGDPPLHLIIFTKGMAVSPLYSTLYDFAFDNRFEFIGLVFPHQRVKIYGKNLSALILKLATHSVEFIYEYGSTPLTLPPDNDPAKDPFIERIEIEGAQIDSANTDGGRND